MTRSGSPDAITNAARANDRERFADVFAESAIYFLCVPERFAEGLPVTASREEIIAQTEQAARDLSERQDFAPFVYDDGGRRRMPLFSTEDNAAGFARWFAKHTRRLIPLQVLGVDGRMLIPALRACDDVALDDRTDDEYLLTADDIQRLEKRAT